MTDYLNGGAKSESPADVNATWSRIMSKANRVVGQLSITHPSSGGGLLYIVRDTVPELEQCCQARFDGADSGPNCTTTGS